MRDGLGVLLVAAGLTWAVVTGDKLGLVIAFAGVTLLAYGVLAPHSSAARGDGKEPPSFTRRASWPTRRGNLPDPLQVCIADQKERRP
jgi:hypothetical protein